MIPKRILIFILLLAYVLIIFSAAPLLAWPVPDTGQTTCYDDVGNVIPCPSPGERFYGQDGCYTINPPSYTKLDANGASLPDSASEWVMVRDNVTGLIWEVKRNKDGNPNYDDPRDADNTYTWYDSNPETNGGDAGTPGDGTDTEDFIDDLNDARLGGYSDWRMPTIKELDSIVDLSIPYPGPTISTAYFPNTQADWYWSSITKAWDLTGAWDVAFRWGQIGDYGPDEICSYKYKSYYVRAVRGVQTSSGFIDNGNGTVTDTSTGLTWQATASGTYTWEAALSYCENLTLGGRSDWRPPNRKELRSIMDYSRYGYAINADFFPGVSSGECYSSTTYAGSNIHAWGMYFYYGYDDVLPKAYNVYYVRAVRGGQSGWVGGPVIAMSPMSGPPGTTFTEWGTGFTSNSTATLHFKKPDGTEYPTQAQPIDAIGHFEISYTAPYEKPPGIYTWWAVDGVTGKVSNSVDYEVTSQAAVLSVTPVNPQSDPSFFDNFFPYPNSGQLITGGTESKTIAADGESRLLLRIRASGPCTATIQVEGNVDENGGLTSLANYRYGDPASTVSVPVTQYPEGYFGFAVYHAPKDFMVPGYENKLTRPVNLKLTSALGNADIPLTLRRPPILISHGLWSSAWGNTDMENFRTLLWERFTDRADKNITDYIWLNDCFQQNASAFYIGATKTRSNIKTYLKLLRSKGATVTQVDYLGHSMGGIWGRMVEQKFSKDEFTYDKGYLHKLITLDTPHGGSFIADIGQYVLDYAEGISLFGAPDARAYFCWFSNEFYRPFCDGAIENLTSYGCVENLNQISVPCHAIVGNKPIDTACALLSASTWVSGGSAEPIVKILKVSEWILKKINPDYGCENWFNQFDFSSQTDLVVDVGSQKGGLYGSCLTEFEHKHTASFYADVNLCFFDLLNKGINDDAFAAGFPASSSLVQTQALPALKPALRSLSTAQTASLGEIQFVSPVDGAIVAPGEAVNVELTLTGTLTLNNVLIMAPGSDAVELVTPPYTTQFTVPIGAYGDFVISALGEGTDGNLYAASVTLNVNNTAGLDHVTVAPEALYLDLGQEMNLTVTGTYSDGTVRDLSAAIKGTVYASSDEAILTISGDGMVTPHAVGIGFVKVTPSGEAPVVVRVEIVEPYLDKDTDDDGILDEVEDSNHNGIVDAGETDPYEIDTDGDGIQDGTEMGVTLAGIGTDTDTGIFQPDLDNTTTTDPLNPDTDGDGLSDGEEDANHNGRVDAGETDPTAKNARSMPWVPLLLLGE
jgi:hypothetical protein